jgi:hemerythrin-like domain-containing protein
MAEQTLPEEEKGQLTEAFADLDADEASEGVREKYVALADKLEAEAG